MVEIIVTSNGKTYDLVKRWRARLGQRRAGMDVTRAEARAVLAALEELETSRDGYADAAMYGVDG